jgi:shikimate dehydrogenase
MPTELHEKTILVGLIGAGIQASKTPAMHMREADALGIRYVYRLIDLEQLGLDDAALPDLLLSAERMGFNGLNITFPCKEAVVAHLDSLAGEARVIGAVNTVVLGHKGRIGYNTDSRGFAASFREGLADVPRVRVVQLGAGGAGRAVAHALLNEGVGELGLYDIDGARAEALAGRLTREFGAGRAVVTDDCSASVAEADGLVNTTPVGMASMPGTPLPAECLRPTLWVADIVYFPRETELLRQARVLGCRTLDGSLMAVYQAVEAFELFTGIAPNAQRMRRHFAAV